MGVLAHLTESTTSQAYEAKQILFPTVAANSFRLAFWKAPSEPVVCCCRSLQWGSVLSLKRIQHAGTARAHWKPDGLGVRQPHWTPALLVNSRDHRLRKQLALALDGPQSYVPRGLLAEGSLGARPGQFHFPGSTSNGSAPWEACALL